MKKIIDYIIIYEAEISNLIMDIQNQIDVEWQPYGPLVVNNETIDGFDDERPIYYQAMVKYEDDDEKINT